MPAECAPCWAILRVALRRLLALQVIGLGLDEERKLRNVARTLEINYPVLVADLANPDNAALLPQWGNSEQIVPYTVVISQTGRMVYIHRGRMCDEEFNLYVKPLLEGGSTNAS